MSYQFSNVLGEPCILCKKFCFICCGLCLLSIIIWWVVLAWIGWCTCSRSSIRWPIGPFCEQNVLRYCICSNNFEKSNILRMFYSIFILQRKNYTSFPSSRRFNSPTSRASSSTTPILRGSTANSAFVKKKVKGFELSIIFRFKLTFRVVGSTFIIC